MWVVYDCHCATQDYFRGHDVFRDQLLRECEYVLSHAKDAMKRPNYQLFLVR